MTDNKLEVIQFISIITYNVQFKELKDSLSLEFVGTIEINLSKKGRSIANFLLRPENEIQGLKFMALYDQKY